MAEISGRCFCGQLTYAAQAPILWAAVCHCEDCRRAASADYVSWFGVKKTGVTWTGKRTVYSSSPGVERSFCPACGSPMSFETEVFEDETHLYAPTLDDPALYRPTAHIFWSEHLPWVTGNDDLPKHPKGLQDAAKKGSKLL